MTNAWTEKLTDTTTAPDAHIPVDAAPTRPADDNWDEFTSDQDSPTDPELDDTAHTLFDGDTGVLREEQRRTLVVLQKRRYLWSRTHPTEWAVLVDDIPLFTSRLHDAFIDLVVDRERGIAYKRKVADPTGEHDWPTLLYDASYTREETILLVFLRTRYRSARSDGDDDVIVDIEEMTSAISRYRAPGDTDISGEGKKARNAIESIRKAGILIKTADEHRMRISPVLEVLLPLPKLGELLDWLITENSDGTPAPGATPGDTEAGSGVDDLDDSDEEDLP